MSKILFLTLVFAPDGVSTAVLMTDLAEELRQKGHEVTVLTTTPHYNVDSEARAVQPLQSKWGKWLYESDRGGMPVYHVAVREKGSRVGARLLDYLRFHVFSTLAGLTLAKEFDVIFVPSPPLTIGVNAWLLRLFRRKPFIYNVQEIWPELPIRLGIIKHPLLIAFFEWLEKFVYRRADAITVISEYFRRDLEAKGVPSAKMRIIPNFIDTQFVQPGERHNDFAREHGLVDKFVISYAGNIGLTQDFETILASAAKLQDSQSVQFVIIGDGARRQWLEDQIARLELDNVLLLPYQPRSVVPNIYASSDLCLVPLKQGAAQDTFPSKVYTVMSSGRPVLATAETESELAWVVEQAQVGWVIEPENPELFTQTIQDILDNREERQSKGEKGRAYVLKNHSPAIVAQQYDELIRQLTNV